METSTEKLSTALGALTELEGRLTFQISRLSKLLDTHAKGLLGKHGLNLPSYRLLMVTKLFEELTVSDLSSITAIDRAQVSRTVAELQQSGFIETRQDPFHKKRKLLRISTEGDQKLSTVMPELLARQRSLASQLTDEELTHLHSSIRKLSKFALERIEQAPEDYEPGNE